MTMAGKTLERIDYRHDGVALNGLLARPAGTPRGAIVVFPTIANATPPIEHRANLLAQAGFIALIADFYGEPVDGNAQALATALRSDVDRYRGRIGAAIATLRALAPGLTLSAIGYCMGGQAVLEAARGGEDLALVASFHGLLSTDRPATTPIVPRILICHGDADPLVPRAQVLAFWEEMGVVGANWHFHSYAGVLHGFTNPGSDAFGRPEIGYNASADSKSWAALTGLLDEVYG
jgi:dienelactone hydrolase